MATILDTIMARKVEEVAARQAQVSIAVLEEKAAGQKLEVLRQRCRPRSLPVKVRLLRKLSEPVRAKASSAKTFSPLCMRNSTNLAGPPVCRS